MPKSSAPRTTGVKLRQTSILDVLQPKDPNVQHRLPRDSVQQLASGSSAAAQFEGVAPASPVPPEPLKPSFYSKTSSAENADVYDELEEYRLAKRYLTRTRMMWANASPGDQKLQDSYLALTSQQRTQYWLMRDMLDVYVIRDIGEDKFADMDTRWIWNWATWHKTIMFIAESMSPCDDVAQDCWFSHASFNHAKGYPKYRISVGRFEIRSDANHNARDRYTFYKHQFPSKDRESNICRVMATLKLGPAPSDAQASHLCANVPQRCVNPAHLLWEKGAENKSRNYCGTGQAYTCIHEPRCIFTDTDGRWLKHRNANSLEPCDCEGVKCMDARTVKMDAGNERTL